MIYTPRIAPFINVNFWVTSIFGPRGSGVHRAIDIATASSKGSVPLYSMGNGHVIYVNNNKDASTYGYYIIYKDDTTKNAFLYAHLRDPLTLRVGDKVKIGDFIGMEGATGNVTGLHLHLEIQYLGDSDTWKYGQPLSAMINPADFMGIPNVKGTECYYEGTPTPPIPTPSKPLLIKSKFKWVLYRRKIRSR